MPKLKFLVQQFFFSILNVYFRVHQVVIYSGAF